MAATLSRSARRAGLALGTSAVLLGIGAVLVMGHGTGPFGIVRLCAMSLYLLLSEPVLAL